VGYREVDRYILRSDWSNGYKNNVGNAYADWVKFKGFEYTPRKYKKEEKLPYVPTERDIDQLISGTGSKLSTFLQLLKESAFRPIEAMGLTPDDFDLNQRLCYLNKPAKGSNPRVLRISEKLTAMITRYTKKTPRGSRIWSGRLEHLRRNYEMKRRSLAEKLQNPNLLKISFRTFRHWKATIEYHRTKDILHVERMLGNKNIQNTLIYTHLVDLGEEDGYISNVAANTEDAQSLIECRFEYITTFNDMMIFRIRK